MSTAVDAGKALPETERLVVGGPAFTESVTAGWAKHTPPSNATPRNMPAIRPADFKLAFILDLLLFFGLGVPALASHTRNAKSSGGFYDFQRRSRRSDGKIPMER